MTLVFFYVGFEPILRGPVGYGLRVKLHVSDPGIYFLQFKTLINLHIICIEDVEYSYQHSRYVVDV